MEIYETKQADFWVRENMHMRRMHISMGIMLKVLLIRALSFPFGNVAIIAQGSAPVNRFLKTPIVFLLYLHFVHVLEKL